MTTSDASMDVGAVRVTLAVPQRPIMAGQQRRFCVRTEVDGIQVDLTKGTLSLASDMSTGGNRYTLTENPDGCHATDVVCPAARRVGTRRSKEPLTSSR